LPTTGASIRAPSGGHGAIENLSLTRDRGGGLPRRFRFLDAGVRRTRHASAERHRVDRRTLAVKAAQAPRSGIALRPAGALSRTVRTVRATMPP
jgi:hypothetical protein